MRGYFMRSLVLIALAGTCIMSSNLVGQSLAEHAAAAAGATIGTAAGKPLGTSLGKIFGGMDKTASTAATPAPKAVNPDAAKPAPTGSAAGAPRSTPALAVGGDDAGPASGSASQGHSAVLAPVAHHRSARRRQPEAEPIPTAPITPITPVIAAPVVKEPTAQQVASIKVGASASELHELLGAPESKVSIPGDDGHLLEICQYWANGEPVGTVRLDNGRVVSVQAAN